MIKSITATTHEIDDIDIAVKEITAALDIKKNLLKNSIGIISCYSEFIDTGVLKAICETLPFDCIGATTNISSSGKETSQLILSIAVLTSNDCCFKTATLPITQGYEQSIASALLPIISGSEEKPALLLSYFPLMNSVSGDMILSAIDKVTDGVPLFGTTAVDHHMDYATAQTIHNGEAFREAAVLGMVYGAFSCTFEIASLNENKIRKQKAIITGSDGNILTGVNGKSALEYLDEIGLTEADLKTGLGILPLVVDYKDGAKPVARSAFAITPDGHVVCGGAMPVGATLAIGRVDASDVLYTTEKTLTPLVEKDSFVLSYSCMARYFALGANSAAEAEKVIELTGDMHYLFACSGGEVCPLADSDGKLKNYYHNYTNAFCTMS